MHAWSPPEYSDDVIAGRWRVFQRRVGHRYSVDDVATAWEACRTTKSPARILDLGCGVGSVLLMTAYRHQNAECFGVEAQDISYRLALSNVLRNQLSERITVLRGDIRNGPLLSSLGKFDLVTGTPPYKTPREGTLPADSQRAHARFELRGGVDAYLQAASQVIHSHGVFVLCAVHGHAKRIKEASAVAGLTVVTRRDVVPRVGKPPLFSVWTFRVRGGQSSFGGGPRRLPTWNVRTHSGVRTLRSQIIRRYFGITGLGS